MAFRTQKISQMTPKGADLEATDLIEVSTIESGSYVTRSITGQELIDAIPLPPTGLTIGTTPIASGTIGRVLFQGTGNVLQQSSSLFWDSTNNRLGIGTETPANPLEISYNSVTSHGIHLNTNTTANSFNGIRFSANNTNPSTFALNNQSGEFRWGVGTGGYFPTIYSNGSERLRIPTTGNVLINTTTDAGFRLDVNGTARFSDNLTIQGNQKRLILRETISGSTFFGIDFIASNASTIASILSNQSSGEIRNFVASGGYFSTFYSNGSERMRIPTTGNVLINTTTDAGFRLDVNGTARVSGRITAGDASTAGDIRSNPSVAMNFGGGQTTNTFTFRQINSGSFSGSALDQSLINLAINQAESTNNPNRGSIISMSGTINNTGINTYVYRGIYYNPTITSLTNTTHYAFHSTSGRIRFENLPTSATGLNTGELWNDGGTLKIV